LYVDNKKIRIVYRLIGEDIEIIEVLESVKRQRRDLPVNRSSIKEETILVRPMGTLISYVQTLFKRSLRLFEQHLDIGGLPVIMIVFKQYSNTSIFDSKRWGIFK